MTEPRPEKTPAAVLAVLALSAVALALALRSEALQMGVGGLVTDQLNAMPLAAAADFPGHFEGDLFADPAVEARYIPLYLGLLRGLAGAGCDYVNAAAWLLAGATLLYLGGWWRLFRCWCDPWTAGALAFLARGVVLLPGGELWGIDGLWTVLPRTLFLAILPWILWSWLRTEWWRGWAAALALALLAIAVHPLSGLTVATALVAGEAARRGCRPGCAVGMASGVLIALAGLGWIAPAAEGVSIQALREAMALRFQPDILSPIVHARAWLRPLPLALLLGPWLALRVLFPARWDELRATRRALLGFSVGCLFAAAAALALQAALQAAGRPVFLAFNMIRATKYLLVAPVLLGGLLVGAAVDRAAAYPKAGRRMRPALALSLVGLTLVLRWSPAATHPTFARTPLRYLWPEAVGPRLPPVNAGQNDDVGAALDWIVNHTPVGARFAGPAIVRLGALRPVIHDHKGASMLVESNPAAFLAWADRERALRAAERDGPKTVAELYRGWGAAYWLTENVLPECEAIYDDGRWRIYGLGDGGRLD